MGRSGGIISIWGRNSFTLHNSFHGAGFIGVSGMWKDGSLCNFINVYSPCDFIGKSNLWRCVENEIRNRGGDIWCVLGDFNAVRNHDERKGRSNFSQREIDGFCNFIEDSGLQDLPLSGRKYTWSNSNGLSMSRLDRFLVSDGWLTKWPNSVQKGLPGFISDHCPIILFDETVDWGPKPFRTLDCWFDYPGFKEFVTSQWDSINVVGKDDYVVKEKLKILKDKLKSWNREVFGSLDYRITTTKKELETLDLKMEIGPWEERDAMRRKELKAELWQSLQRRENLIYQKSRSKHVKLSDTNSKFFHNSINIQRKRNGIRGLLVNDRWIEGVSEVKEAVFNHFANQFSNVQWGRPTLDGIQFKQISDQDNSFLLRPFTEEEIKDAIWSCGSGKSPGPDGFNFRFIKEFWQSLKPEIISFINDFHRTGKLVRGFNPSFIVLIPKKDNPLSLKDYRPVSLINSMYKILAKILASRLAAVLNSVISDNQSAFLSTRNIADSILVSNEVIDEAKRENKEVLIFKADFEKAFDSVQWSFLEHMLCKLGFAVKWRAWIMECISTATMSILINGSPTKEFSLGRGLRQGDPLSPLLFLVVAEGLSGLITNAVNQHYLQPFEVGADNVPISHLQFADDTVVITTPNDGNVRVLKAIFLLFELVSGLRINFNKSTLYFVNVEDQYVHWAAEILNCKLGSIPFIYLGVPVGANPRRIETWQPLLDLFKRMLSSWKIKSLSFGGRITLLKSVISSLPVYFFSFYLAPVTVINRLKSLQTKFLWGGNTETRKTAWISWEKVCKPVSCGGLGIRDFRSFNLALLGKWRFKLLNDQTCLWKKVIVSKYGILGSGHECNRWRGDFSKGSYWWRDIGVVTNSTPYSNSNWFGDHVKRDIGDGTLTSFWHHVWVGNTPLCTMFPRLYSVSLDKEKMVAEMGTWNNSSWEWKWNWRRNLFVWESELLSSLSLLLESVQLNPQQQDAWKWNLVPSGLYSVKSAYHVIQGLVDQQEDPFFKSFWCKKLPLKVSSFGWKAIQDRIPSRVNLRNLRIIPPTSTCICPLCNSSEESSNHLLLTCQFSYMIWMNLYSWWGTYSANTSVLRDHFTQHMGLLENKIIQRPWKLLWFLTIWCIWKHRNSIIFRNATRDASEVCEQIRLQSWTWLQHRYGVAYFSFAEWCLDPISCILAK